MSHHLFTTRSAGRRAIVVIAALTALLVAAPLANAARSHTLACQSDPGHWVSVTDDLGVPTLELVGATVCTDAVTGQDCAFGSQSTEPSPYPGWVQITDGIGVPWLYQTGSASTSSADCVQTNVAQSITAGSTAPPNPESSRPTMKSPYPGWVVAYDDQGIPWLEPISQYR